MDYLQHPSLAALPGIRHAFITRPALPPSLFGSGRHLTPAGCAQVLKTLDWGAGSILSLLTQQHTARCLHQDSDELTDARPVADAQVTQRPQLALTIATADCVPVLLADPAARVIGAAHAGWRGALAGVLENTLAAMVALGARTERLVAVLGPCIAQTSYEVGPELRSQFLAERPDNGRFFVASRQAGHALFDLPAYVSDRLRRSGVGAVAALGCDTYADPQRFYSYRRTVHAHESYDANLLATIMLDDGQIG